MIHVVKMLQDSTVAESVVDEAAAMAYYASALNDPLCLLCCGWNLDTSSWLYWYQAEATAPALAIDGREIAADTKGLDNVSDLPDLVLEGTAPVEVVRIRTLDGEVEGQVMISAQDGDVTVIWVRTLDGAYLTALADDIVADDIPIFDDPRAVVLSKELGGPQSRRLERLGMATAYTTAGDITGQVVEALPEFPAPDFLQILVERTVYVVLAAALEPWPEPAAAERVSPEELSVREQVMLAREKFLQESTENDGSASGAEDVLAARDLLIEQLAKLTVQWDIAIDAWRDILSLAPQGLTAAVITHFPAGMPAEMMMAEKAAGKAAGGHKSSGATHTPKTPNKPRRAKKQGVASKS
jgi:hypothetical protein